MEDYLGEVVVDVKDTKYKDYTTVDWARFWIWMYGGVDGAHHKDWTMDQVVRITLGTKVIIKQANWKNGRSEMRVNLDEPTQAYRDWVNEYEEGGYEYDEEIAP